jgi:3D (Asp-Asp-Asp) domain-containing protein
MKFFGRFTGFDYAVIAAAFAIVLSITFAGRRFEKFPDITNPTQVVYSHIQNSTTDTESTKNDVLFQSFAQKIGNLENQVFELKYKNNLLIKDLKFYSELVTNIINYSKKHSKIYKIKRLSCYTPSHDETDSTPHTTAINKKVKVGRTAAVSPDLEFMLGKYIYIHGYGVFEVTDVTHSRYKKTIDLCLSKDKSYCEKFGVKENVNAVILYSKSKP